MAVTKRGAAIERLAGGEFDLLVIGGGIIGAGIAALAARNGLAVALVDKGDFGGATSTASSKLIHGGLRYLRLGDDRLVRESLQERRLLSRVVTPHLVRRIPFVFPVYRGGPYGPATIQTGLVLYGAFARSRLHWLASGESARELVPSLRVAGLRSCGVYADATTHDGRLCLANVRAAEDAGGVVLNYAKVRELRIVGGRVVGATVVVDGESVVVSAKAVVNATGPWVDLVRRLEDPAAAPTIRLSKGAHVLVRLDEPWEAALTIPHDKVRVSFAVPWEDMLLLGTTDTLYEGEPSAVEASDEDVEQILEEASVAVDAKLLRADRIRSTYAGLRVLPGGDGATARARRETVFHRGKGGMLSVAGGKLTTYRRIALDALNMLGLRRVDRRPFPLPGAGSRASFDTRDDVDPRIRANLWNHYGTLANAVLAPAAEDPDLLRALHSDGPDIAAQVVYARDFEWAVRAEDVVWRRTTLSLRGLAQEATPLVEELLDPDAALRVRPQV
ncbi:MAG: glycerol-3-phosphate dehydrogenase/oxidase [Actinobacteria bacterium]|nr:MAG: glycerol-3-phosphate dehydrogenase/oxidase [Actinomycetota bacterium]